MACPSAQVPFVDAGSVLLALAGLLQYPGEGSGQAIVRARLELSGNGNGSFERFAGPFLSLAPEAREELYTGTFDITPACVAYVSIHLFGEENFKRGEFMAALNARYASAGFDPGGELPDHLAILVRFAAGIEVEERRELTEFCLLGPLGKMIAALSDGNPYRALLETVREVLVLAHPGVQPAVSPLEQMRQHGLTCDVRSPACGCGHEPGPGTSSDPLDCDTLAIIP